MYNSRTVLNDVGILKLSKSVTLTSFIQPSCLPSNQSSQYPNVSIPAWAIGFGTTVNGGFQMTQYLRNVQLTNSHGPSYCANYAKVGAVVNWSSQLCAGLYSGGKEAF